MIPASINICGVPYGVMVCPDVFDTDTQHLGEIEYKRCEIRIAADMPEAMQMQTLIHEWVHGALFAIGYDELRSDEKFVQNLAMAIRQTFQIKENHNADSQDQAE